mgnify:CR=1 FL=1
MHIDENDFAIVFSPDKDKSGNWVGSCMVRSIFASNKWNKKDATVMMEMITLLTSCVPLLEEDDSFLDHVQREREDLINAGKLTPIYEYNGEEKKEVVFTPIIKVEDNVIHVDLRKDKK